MRAAAMLPWAALASLTALTQPSTAISYHPWCARYFNRSYAIVCAFDTQAQCLADVSGVGGFCSQNVAAPPPYLAPRPYAGDRMRKRRHRPSDYN